ncbi:hypothetical protein PHJA_001485300 [Phtheirospermum japonicum]|uniref:Uncharacterized protein n=1 Tax=Phtheirospermum japonicum TaxID=374723 RepID=A0A830C2Y4_9LAMI|nr:hypothetical protein PHJA_001485300 [Phtheirospermum japonicum]
MHPAADNSHAAAPRSQIAPRDLRSEASGGVRPENQLRELTGSGQPRRGSGESEEAEGGDPVKRDRGLIWNFKERKNRRVSSLWAGFSRIDPKTSAVSFTKKQCLV